MLGPWRGVSLALDPVQPEGDRNWCSRGALHIDVLGFLVVIDTGLRLGVPRATCVGGDWSVGAEIVSENRGFLLFCSFSIRVVRRYLEVLLLNHGLPLFAIVHDGNRVIVDASGTNLTSSLLVLLVAAVS